MSELENPIFVREVRQAARVTRTPVVLMAISTSVTLLIAALGGVLTDDKAPDQVGVAVYRVFFSVSFAVASLVGAAVAANSVAAEREGRTFEALVLTSLRPSEIARGKFLAALASVGAYLLVIAPAGALAFLFGGVAASEVVIAFLYVGLFAATFVGLGLAISSKMASIRSALLVTLLVVFPLSMILYGFGGVGGGQMASRVWPLVPRDEPVWIPLAYVRGELGEPYLVTLVLTPVIGFAVAWWLFYEVTVANLKSPTDDRSSGLKRWFALSMPMVCGVALAWLRVIPASSRYPSMVLALVSLALLLGFSVMVFVGDPVVPSGRVRNLARAARWSALRRFMGPGVVGAGFLQMLVGTVTLGGLWAGIDALSLVWRADPAELGELGDVTGRLVPVGFGYAVATIAAFHFFLVGLGSTLRLRHGEGATRVRLATVTLVLAIVPWIVAALVGAFTSDSSRDMLPATVSPLYAFNVIRSTFHNNNDAMTFWIVAYAIVGLALQLRAAFVAKNRVVAVEAQRAAA